MVKGCFNTPLEHTPKPSQKRLKRDFFHNWLGGLPGVCSRGVLKQPLKWTVRDPGFFFVAQF